MCAVSTALLWPFRCELASLVNSASCNKGSGPLLRRGGKCGVCFDYWNSADRSPIPLIATGGDESIRSGGEDGG
jgi:hypothetical protein